MDRYLIWLTCHLWIVVCNRLNRHPKRFCGPNKRRSDIELRIFSLRDISFCSTYEKPHLQYLLASIILQLVLNGSRLDSSLLPYDRPDRICYGRIRLSVYVNAVDVIRTGKMKALVFMWKSLYDTFSLQFWYSVKVSTVEKIEHFFDLPKNQRHFQLE